MNYPSDRSYQPYQQQYADPTPWAAGLAVTITVALLTAVAVYSFGDALAQVHPLLSAAVIIIAVGGAAPTAWRYRKVLVTRWVLGGVVVGVLVAWLVLVVGWLILLADWLAG